MIKQTLTIQNRLGLHARAASLFVKTASGFGASITVRHLEGDSKAANGKSIMSVMMLQAVLGNEIEITAEGEDEAAALAALEALINNKFGEGE